MNSLILQVINEEINKKCLQFPPCRWEQIIKFAKTMKAIKLDLNSAEKDRLKKAGVKISQLSDFAIDELAPLNEHRAKALNAHLVFQRLPSIGPKFAQDLVDMGYYSLGQLKGRDGADLLNEHERFVGYQTDPCVEDQFRLIVHYANNPGVTKQWWDFTPERKAFRAKFGYPATRPGALWHEIMIE